MGQVISYGNEAVAPWRPFDQVIKMSPHQLAQYYDDIWNDPKGLTALQKYCVQAHVDDIRAAARSTGRLQRARTSPVYSIVRYLYIVTTLVFKTFLSNPTVPFTDPVNWAFSLVAYGTIFVVLTFLQVVFTIGYLLGAPHLIKWLSQKYGNGQVLVTMASPEFYTNKTPIFAEAIKVLSTAAPKVPDVPGLRNDGSLETDKRTRQDVIVFNTDVAKAMVTMCTLVYERNDDYVKLACDYPESAIQFLLRSEELMFAYSRVWGLDFVSISDFLTVSGPFASAFYRIRDLGPNEHPFIVICLKGTSPTNLAEWATDGTLNLEDVSDNLGAGLGHQGFYTSLFPDDGDRSLVKAPYQRIVETVKQIASQAKSDKKTQVFVTGHSLGAGMASVLYARLLESPEDLGNRCELRDVYMYGTPRALDADATSRFDLNLRKTVNYNRMAFRVCNHSASRIVGDIVARVPPGMCDERCSRAAVQRGSLLSYAAVGIQVALRPHMGSPFYTVGPVPVGSQFRVEARTALSNEYGFEAARQQTRFKWPENPVEAADLAIKILVPFIADHYPTSYYESLCALQVHVSAKELAAIENQVDPEAPVKANTDGPPGSGSSGTTTTTSISRKSR